MGKFIVALLAAFSWFMATPMIGKAEETKVEDRKVWRVSADWRHHHHHGRHQEGGQERHPVDDGVVSPAYVPHPGVTPE